MGRERPLTHERAKGVELKKKRGEGLTTGLKASLLLVMLSDQVQLTVAQGMSSGLPHTEVENQACGQCPERLFDASTHGHC